MNQKVSLPDATAHHREIERLINAFVGKPPGPRINFKAREAALLDIFDHCGFSTRHDVQIQQRTEIEALGYIDLLGIPELRGCLWKHAPTLQSRRDG